MVSRGKNERMYVCMHASVRVSAYLQAVILCPHSSSYLASHMVLPSLAHLCSPFMLLSFNSLTPTESVEGMMKNAPLLGRAAAAAAFAVRLPAPAR